MSDTTLTAPASPDLAPLRARLSGHAVAPGDPDWDEARLAWNLAVDQRPAAVVLPVSVDDVVATVEFARGLGLRIAPQGTGHGAAAMGPLDGTILLKTSRMTGVEIDAADRRARVTAGTLWADVVAAAAEHGLAALAGSSPDVGVVGYTLGGGVSWLGRRFGLSTNSVLAVEVVTADGRLLRADADGEGDLFWALRGGGGSFGVVTALEIRLYPVTEVYAGVLFWPIARASEVLHAWRRWVEDVPDELTSVGRLLRFPPLPDIPEPLRGGSFVVVEAVFLGDEARGAELIRPLRGLGPELDSVRTIPAAELGTIHMDPPQPVPGIGDGLLLEDLPEQALDALLAAEDPTASSPLLSVEIRLLGGELANAAPAHGALAAVDARFGVYAVGIPMSPEVAAAVEHHLEGVKGALAPWEARQHYLNFSERPTDPRRFFAEAAYGRLAGIKRAVDPDDLFRANHPVR